MVDLIGLNSREVICHATAWDFNDGEDFRVKMCGSDYDFGVMTTIHHELGHTQYQQQYKDLPLEFRYTFSKPRIPTTR